jgi:hypothetical protein
MKEQELTTALAQFTGTDGYTRLYPKLLLTDGALFLAENAQCFWLMDVFASHLMTAIDANKEPFPVSKKHGKAMISMPKAVYFYKKLLGLSKQNGIELTADSYLFQPDKPNRNYAYNVLARQLDKLLEETNLKIADDGIGIHK